MLVDRVTKARVLKHLSLVILIISYLICFCLELSNISQMNCHTLYLYLAQRRLAFAKTQSNRDSLCVLKNYLLVLLNTIGLYYNIFGCMVYWLSLSYEDFFSYSLKYF